MTFLSPSYFQLPSLHPVDVTFSDKKPQGLPALEMWFTIDFFFPNIPELWPIWVGIYKSFQYTLMIQMPSCFLNAHVTHIERLLQLSTPWKVDGDEDELMISKKPRKNAHHYSSSFLYA